MVTSNQNLLRVGPKAGTLWSLIETFHSQQAWLTDEEGNVLQEFCIHYTVSSIIVKHKKEKWNYHHMISESPKGLLWQPVFPPWLEQCLSRKCLQIYWMVPWLEQENVRSLRARTLVCCPSAQNCPCRTVNTQYAQLSPSSFSIYYPAFTTQSCLRCSGTLFKE